MKNSEDKKAQRFLIISTTGIGDILMGTPALRALRESFPSSEIHLLVNSKRKDLVRRNPHVDRVFGYRDNSWFRTLLFFKTFSYDYDYVLVFHSNEDVLKVLRMVRYGVSYNRQNYEDQGRRLFPLDSLPRHSIQKRLALVEKVGGKKSADYRYEYAIPESGAQWASDQLNQWGLSPEDRLVGMQPGAADAFKCWPVEYFVEVARYLRSKHGMKIYLNVSSAERALVERFLRLFGREDVIYNRRENLSHSAALIQRCALFITPDTGPMHMAMGLGVPLIGLFSPTEVEETGPLAYEKATLIRKPKTCDPCRGRECRDNLCMRQITVEEVCLAADHMLRNDFRGRGEARV
jgi:ADP-heptose:LPS heptosyltransferase